MQEVQRTHRHMTLQSLLTKDAKNFEPHIHLKSHINFLQRSLIKNDHEIQQQDIVGNQKVELWCKISIRWVTIVFLSLVATTSTSTTGVTSTATTTSTIGSNGSGSWTN